MACPGFLLCLWQAVQAALLSCFGRAVGDCLTFLRDQAVAQFIILTFSCLIPQVELINTPTAHLVGLEEINGYLKEIGGYLNDDAVGIIGIYGMGLVGKTTLLRMVNNDFRKLGVPGMDVVIYVTVPEDASVLMIQKQIGDRLGLSLPVDPAGSSDEQAKRISKVLSKMKFLLLLDGVWDKLDPSSVGIPSPTATNKCKIILTTRSMDVCVDMSAQQLVHVNTLNVTESWKLFKKSLGPFGTEVDNDNRFAAVVAKCGGLPEALITVGHAMATATSSDPVRRARLRRLRETPHELRNMKDKVLSPLKVSFDRLGDENTQQCLLYCCLFPEDSPIIPVEEVVESWVGEGFFDGSLSDSIRTAREKGHEVIETLKSACLLENGRENVSCVKMHGVVRGMCLWLTGGECEQNPNFLVYAGSDRVRRSERWEDATRISLMYNSSQDLPSIIQQCRNLRTLLCNHFASLRSIPRGFFEFMHVLCVLNLSHCRLESLPEEIGSLAELRYLNLQGTFIESLPRGLGNLARLSQLDLDETSRLSYIAGEAIRTLTGLQVLRMFKSSYDFNLPHDNMGEDTRSCWDRLEELRLSVYSSASLEVLLQCERLRSCTTHLRINVGGKTDITAAHLYGALEKLEKVQFLDVNGDRRESEFYLEHWRQIWEQPGGARIV